MYFVLDFVEAKDIVGQEDGLILNETDLVFNFVETEDAAVDAVIDLVDSVGNVAECAGIADDILDAADFVLDLIKAEDIVGQEDSLIFDATDFIFNLSQAKGAISE